MVGAACTAARGCGGRRGAKPARTGWARGPEQWRVGRARLRRHAERGRRARRRLWRRAKLGHGSPASGCCAAPLVLGHLAPKFRSERVEPAVEALSDAGEPPDVWK
ncbi:hypothetical protein GCM10023238_38920 [Streptomyces heliomycini]